MPCLWGSLVPEGTPRKRQFAERLIAATWLVMPSPGGLKWAFTAEYLQGDFMKYLLILSGFLVVGCSASMSRNVASTSQDEITIVSSGSTNSKGWTIHLAADGAAEFTMAGKTSNFTAPSDFMQKFVSDLTAAQKSGNAGPQSCMKSASFGMTIKIQWQGWSSQDFGCPVDPNGVSAPLARDYKMLLQDGLDAAKSG
jgi:hypothetical protein